MQMLKTVLDLFGSTILVPIVVFILCLCLKVQAKKAFQGAIFMGIGLTAFNIILGGLMGTLAPVVVEMVQNTGINLPVIDVGWPAAAMIVFANQLGLFYLIFGLGWNLFLFLTKWTDTFEPTDIFNYYQFLFFATIVMLVTKSFWMGVASCMFMNLLQLLLADILAPSLQEHYGYEGVTCTAFGCVQCAPMAILVRWILLKLKVREIKLDPETLREKFGFWGEPVSMGLIIGLAIAIVAKFSKLGAIATWADILKTAVLTGAIMAIYPAVSGLFVKGLIPISQTLNARLRSGEMKRANFNIGIDPAVFFGEEANLTTGLILIPIVLAISIILPGNLMLPLADLPAMPFMVIGIVTVMRGNIFNSVIVGTLWYPIALWCNSDIAPVFTEAAKSVGVQIPDGGAMVSSFCIGSNPILWAVYKAWTATGINQIIGIGATIAIYAVLLFMFKKHRRAWWLAAGASPEFLDERAAANSGASA